jgi:hypothetical protein
MKIETTDKVMRNYNRFYQISFRDYAAMARVSNECEKFGVESVDVKQLENGKPGIAVEMASGNWEYHLRLESNSRIILGRENRGKREKLYEGNPNLVMSWDRLIELVANSEGKA